MINEAYLVIGAIFAILYLLSLWYQARMFRIQTEKMTNNMILAIEKLEWRENGKNKEE